MTFIVAKKMTVVPTNRSRGKFLGEQIHHDRWASGVGKGGGEPRDTSQNSTFHRSRFVIFVDTCQRVFKYLVEDKCNRQNTDSMF